ncbi:hypothetical protein QBC35DRAFT_461709 [Podospora australis]|uniref:Uncharacterized protein n=1 Tax=Podospora australis TaxID=1536484 RepID=A0AAN6X085_9PEZI|nr:hypothetical protein QBC35DRAFT_461709 [Podospora australis]
MLASGLGHQMHLQEKHTEQACAQPRPQSRSVNKIDMQKQEIEQQGPQTDPAPGCPAIANDNIDDAGALPTEEATQSAESRLHLWPPTHGPLQRDDTPLPEEKPDERVEQPPQVALRPSPPTPPALRTERFKPPGPSPLGRTVVNASDFELPDHLDNDPSSDDGEGCNTPGSDSTIDEVYVSPRSFFFETPPNIAEATPLPRERKVHQLHHNHHLRRNTTPYGTIWFAMVWRMPETYVLRSYWGTSRQFVDPRDRVDDEDDDDIGEDEDEDEEMEWEDILDTDSEIASKSRLNANGDITAEGERMQSFEETGGIIESVESATDQTTRIAESPSGCSRSYDDACIGSKPVSMVAHDKPKGESDRGILYHNSLPEKDSHIQIETTEGVQADEGERNDQPVTFDPQQHIPEEKVQEDHRAQPQSLDPHADSAQGISNATDGKEENGNETDPIEPEIQGNMPARVPKRGRNTPSPIHSPPHKRTYRKPCLDDELIPRS